MNQSPDHIVGGNHRVTIVGQLSQTCLAVGDPGAVDDNAVDLDKKREIVVHGKERAEREPLLVEEAQGVSGSCG